MALVGRPGAIVDDGWLDTRRPRYLDSTLPVPLRSFRRVFNRGGRDLPAGDRGRSARAAAASARPPSWGLSPRCFGERPVAYSRAGLHRPSPKVCGSAARGSRRAAAAAQAAQRVLSGRRDAGGSDRQISRRLLTESVVSCSRELHPVGHSASRVSAAGDGCGAFPAAHHRVRRSPAGHHGGSW